MDTNYLDKTLLNLVSIGRESDPARIEKLETMKKEMLDYAASRKNESERPMSYLYDEFQLPTVAEMLSYIAEVSLLQDFKEIDRDDKAQMEAVPIYEVMKYMYENDLQKDFMLKTGAAQSVADYVFTKDNIAFCWMHLIAFIVIFAFLAMVALKFVDKDKR